MCMGKNPNYRSNLTAIRFKKCRVVFRARRNQSQNYMFQLYFQLSFQPNLIQIRYFLFQIEFKVDQYLEIFGVGNQLLTFRPTHVIPKGEGGVSCLFSFQNSTSPGSVHLVVSSSRIVLLLALIGLQIWLPSPSSLCPSHYCG